ncbi:hypothetical protein AKJ09_00893 [Labilithrix luteola]|uniref:Uncharacterized protein n=1 Tax=Labilithrix luteola TaxID=1391654 RepID=A0A0K1PMB4_9BACT|nr:hypothetical protein AKJ09_00893 [Labilithrix luteola]
MSSVIVQGIPTRSIAERATLRVCGFRTAHLSRRGRDEGARARGLPLCGGVRAL